MLLRCTFGIQSITPAMKFLYYIRSFTSVRKQIEQLGASRKSIYITETDIEEKFIRGWGKGGQNVNKSNNAVYLRHIPSGIEIKVNQQLFSFFIFLCSLVS